MQIRSMSVLRPHILKLLSQQKDKWLSASLIAAQIPIPPEMIQRHSARHKSYCRSSGSTRTSLICAIVYDLAVKRKVNKPLNRRRSESGEWEYQITEWGIQQAESFNQSSDVKSDVSSSQINHQP